MSESKSSDSHDNPVPTPEELGLEIVEGAASGLTGGPEQKLAFRYTDLCRLNRKPADYGTEFGTYMLRSRIEDGEPVTTTMFGVQVVISPIPGAEPADPGNDPQKPPYDGDREPRIPVAPRDSSPAYNTAPIS